MRSLLVASLFILTCSNNGRAADVPDDHRGVGWGVTAGSPQLIGLTLETHQGRTLRFQTSASTLILTSSITGRAIMTRITGTMRPYAFVGGGLLNVSEGDGGGAVGSTGFLWAGTGLAAPLGTVRLFGELGIMGGLDKSKGFESPLPSIAIGLLVAR